MRTQGFLVILLLAVLGQATADDLRRPDASVVPNPRARKALRPKAATDWRFQHQIWGQTYYGEGYVYGPVTRRVGMTTVDIERDGDVDFGFPNDFSDPQVMQNYGSTNAFFLGGALNLDLPPLSAEEHFEASLAFGDLTGDTLDDLCILRANYSTRRTDVLWYKNEGPRQAPHYSLGGVAFISQQAGTLNPALSITLGDIDGDGLLDLYVAESFLSAPFHRVFFTKNIGSATAPAWDSTPEEIRPLSLLLPDRRPIKNTKSTQDYLIEPLIREHLPPNKQTGTTYNIGSILLFDWDPDGLLDFMFYHQEEGLYWIRNIGTRTAPAWSTALGNNGVPLYDHRLWDQVEISEGAFAAQFNPEVFSPGAEWVRDLIMSTNNRLRVFRYYVREQTYRLIQMNTVAYPAGQGSPAFWDFDNDGDLDMFRSGRGFDENPLMLLPNVGVPYSPTWGAPVVLDGVAINQGNDGNYYRGDPFTFADHDLVEGYDLFVQGQDGRVRLYYAYAPAAPGELPTFILAEGNEDWMSVVHPDHTDIVPGGIALADFDYFEDGWAEMIVSYIHDDVGNIVWVDTLNGFLYDLPDLLPAPDGIGALDPYLIESLAAGDLDLDGVPDLVVTISYDSDYAECEQLVYLTVLENEPPFVSFTYAGRLDAVYENDHAYARNIGLGDTDADGDADLFIGHRNPINTSSRYYLRHYVNQEPTKLTFERRRGIAGSNINLALYFYDDSTNYVEVKPDYRIISNPSGGALDGQAIYTAGISAPQVDVLETTNLVADHEQDGERRMFVDVLPTVSRNESKAILVLGTEQGDALHDTFAGLLGWAYQVLLSEGLSKENIYVLSSVAYDLDRDGFNDVAGAPTLAALQQAILNWAPSPNAADPLRRLLVYLIDHGQLNNFRMNASEYLRADVYAGWIDQIQASLFLRPFVTTVVDTCESGSFVDDLSGADRVTITSAGVGPLDGVALFDKDSYISFSLAFWNNIYFGRSYGEAFDASKTSMEAVNPLQTPQIDDNGNGISNETNDGLIADLLRPGANFYLGRPTLFIGEVAPYQAITSNSATLWVAGIQATFPVEEVSAIVVPPNYERATSTTDDEQPVSGLPLVKLQYQEARERWEGVYNGFTQGGQFQILYFVKTAGQFQATPRIGFVDRVNIADAWEPDNTPGTAPWIPINTVQGHNFHQNADEDWVRFTSPAGQKATFGILSPGPNCRPWIELYRQADLEANPNAAPVQSAAAAQRGEEVVFERHFVQAEQYLLRIRSVNPVLFGAGTSYMLIVAVGTGGSEIIPTTLVVSVVNGATDDPLEGAEITFNDSAIGTTTVEGIAYAVVPSYGQYDVEAEKSGYRSTSRRVSVNNIVETVLLEMTEQGAEGEGEGEGDKVPAICGGTPTSQRSLRADLLILAATATLLLVKIGVKRRHS